MRTLTFLTVCLMLLSCIASPILSAAEKEIKTPEWWNDDTIKKQIQSKGLGKDYNETHNTKKSYLPVWGFLHNWMVVGPFDYPNETGFDASYPPQDGFVKGAKFRGSGGKQVTWTPMKPNRHWENHIDMRKLGRKAIIYAHTYYNSDTDRKTKIWFRARDYITIWVNKIRVYESMDSPQDINRNFAEIKLKKGDNSIMIKVSGTGRSHDFWFEVRISDYRFDVAETLYYKTMMELFPAMTPPEREHPYYTMARNLGKMRYFDLAKNYWTEYKKINKEYKNYANLLREMSPWYTAKDTGPYMRHMELMKEFENEYSQNSAEISKDIGAYHNVIRHLGNMARDIGEYDVAVKYYKKMVRVNTNLISRLGDQCTLGLIYCYAGYWEEAQKLYKTVKGFYKEEKKYRHVKYPLRELSRYAKDRKSATQLNDIAGISRYILVGEQYVDSGELKEAVRQFQSTLEKFGSSLYEAAAGHYISAQALCRLKIRDLGSEGIKAYRDTYDGAAGKQFEKARQTGDKKKMLDVFLTYPASGVSDNALYELGNRHLQEGRLDLAALVFGRLLRDFPDTEIKKHEIIMKYAFVLGETGQYGKARKLLKELKDAGSKEDFRIGGRKFSAWDYTERESKRLKELDPEPQFGKSIRAMAKNPAAWSYTFPESEINVITDKRLEPNYIKPLLYTGKAYKGNAYVQNGATVFCISLETGKLVWKRSVPDFLPNWITDDPSLTGTGYAPLHVMDVQVYNGKIYARLIADHPSSGRAKRNFGLFCIDAQTGGLVWGVNDPDGERQLKFLSEPAVGSGVVCMGAYRAGRSGLGDYYILGYDAETGEMLWKTHSGSGLSDIRVEDLTMNPVGAGNAMREEDGVLYVATGFGSVAAIDILSGAMIWAREHDRGSIPNFHNSKGDLDMYNIGILRPVLNEKAVVFAFPDAFGLAAYDRKNGNLLWERKLLKPQYLVGTYLNSLYITTASRVISLNIFDGTSEWEWLLPAREGWSSAIISETKIYLPTKKGLHVLDPMERKETGFLPFDENRPPIGNVVFTGSGVLGFNDSTITYYKMKTDGKTVKTVDRGKQVFNSKPVSFKEGDVTVPFIFFHEAYGKKATYTVDDTGRIFILNGNELYAPDAQQAGRFSWQVNVDYGWKEVYADEGIVVVAYPKGLRVFNAEDGKLKWEKDGFQVERVQINEMAVFVHSYDDYAGIYEKDTGKFLSSFNFSRYERRGGFWPRGATVQWAHRYDYRKRGHIGNCVVYEKNFTSKGAGFDVVFEPKTSEAWVKKTKKMFVVVEGGGSNRNIVGYDAMTASKKWSVKMYWRDLSWIVTDNYVFTPSWRYDNNQYVIDIMTGKVVYKEKHLSDKGLIFKEDPENPKIIYEAKNGNNINVVALDANTGKQIWSTVVSHGRQWQAHGLYVTGNYLILLRIPHRYVYAGNAMYVFDKKDGTLLQSLDIPGLSMNRAEVTGNTLIYRCPEAVFMFKSGNIEESLKQYKQAVSKNETPSEVRRYYSRLTSMYEPKFTYCEPYSEAREKAENQNDIILDSSESYVGLTEDGKWGGKEDLSAVVRTGWTRGGLKVRVTVRDDRHINSYSGKNLAIGDCVMIALNNRSDTSSMHAKNHEYVFALSQGESRSAHVFGRYAYDPPRVKVYYTPDLKDLVYDIYFPWSSLGTDEDHPREKKDLGFSISVLDNDEGIADGMLFWGGGQFGGRQPRMFGELFFVPLDSEGIRRYKQAIAAAPDWPDSWNFFRRIVQNDTSSESDKKAVEYCKWFIQTCPSSYRVPDVMGLMWMHERYLGNMNPEADIISFAQKSKVPSERIDEFKNTFFSFWMYTDPKEPCRDLLVQFHQRYYRGWEHRMVIGNQRAFYYIRRRPKTTEFQQFSKMPQAGKWHQIRFPAGAVDILHQELGVLSFYRNDKRMYIDDVRIGDFVIADDEVTKPHYQKGHWAWTDKVKKKGSKSFGTEIKNTRSSTNIEFWKKPYRIGTELKADVTGDNIEKLKQFVEVVPSTREAFEAFKKVVDAGVSGVPKSKIPRNVLLLPETKEEPADDKKKKKRKKGKGASGLYYEYYEIDGNDVGLMKGQKPKKTGTVSNFETKPREREENIGFIFRGRIKIDKPGEYKFYTNSDDGTILYFNNKMVVNNDGGHGMQERSGSVKGLKPGIYPIELWFKQGGGPHGLEVYWESTNFEERISACVDFVKKNPSLRNAARVLDYAFKKQYLNLEEIETLMSEVRMPSEIRTAFYIATEPSYRNYAFVGPFTEEKSDEILNKEERFTDLTVDLTEQYTGKEDAKIKWWAPFDKADFGYISDHEFRARKQKYVNGDVLYAWARINSPYQRSCTLFTGLQRVSLTAWLNGDRIMSGKYDHSYSKDEHRTEILLNKGWNTILFKIRVTSDWHWQFTTRIGGLFGKSLRDLEISNKER